MLFFPPILSLFPERTTTIVLVNNSGQLSGVCQFTDALLLLAKLLTKFYKSGKLGAYRQF